MELAGIAQHRYHQAQRNADDYVAKHHVPLNIVQRVMVAAAKAEHDRLSEQVPCPTCLTTTSQHRERS